MKNLLQRFMALVLTISALFLLTSCPGGSIPSDLNRLSPTQVRLLADRILENTPEHIHFAEGTVFSWVVLFEEVRANPQTLQDEVMKLLEAKYAVYTDKNLLPDELLMKGEGGQLHGYRGGFSFSYSVQRDGPRHVKVHYSDYEGNLAASGHWKRYKWNGRDWRVMEVSALTVS